MPSAMYSFMRAATVGGIADQRRSGAAAHQADAGPEIGADLQLVAAPAVQLHHASLADRIHAREDRLRAGDGLVADMLDQLIGGPPGFVIGLAHDDVQANAEADLPSALRRKRRDRRDLLRDLRRRLAPGQVFVDGARRRHRRRLPRSRRNKAADAASAPAGRGAGRLRRGCVCRERSRSRRQAARYRR